MPLQLNHEIFRVARHLCQCRCVISSVCCTQKISWLHDRLRLINGRVFIEVVMCDRFCMLADRRLFHCKISIALSAVQLSQRGFLSKISRSYVSKRFATTHELKAASQRYPSESCMEQFGYKQYQSTTQNW